MKRPGPRERKPTAPHVERAISSAQAKPGNPLSGPRAVAAHVQAAIAAVRAQPVAAPSRGPGHPVQARLAKTGNTVAPERAPALHVLAVLGRGLQPKLASGRGPAAHVAAAAARGRLPLRPGQAAVQRMEVAFSASVSTSAKVTIEEHLNRMGYVVEPTANKMRQIRGTNLYLEPKLATSVNNAVFSQVVNLLVGNTWKLYRAVPRFHPNWSEASKGTAKPLGKGTASFDTGSAAWTAWQDDPEASAGMAVSATGMGEKDQIELVSGYAKSDEYVVAVVLETVVTSETPLCFFNSGEVQIRGEVGSNVYQEIRMGTELREIVALAHYASAERTKVAHLLPDPP